MKLIFVVVLCFCLNGRQIVTSHQELGDTCTTTAGEKGTCKLQTDCVELENTSTSSTDFAETCKLHSDGMPIICCITRTNAKRDYVSTRSDFTENDFHEENAVNETETRFANGFRKKPITFTKPSHKVTSKAASYDQDNSKKTHQINTKFYDSYGDTFANPNLISQPSYSDYDNPRPSHGLTNVYSQSPDTVVYRPSGSSTSNTRPGSSNGYNPNHSTGSNGYNPNGGSNEYNPNQSTRPGSSNGYNPNYNTRPSTGSNGHNPNFGGSSEYNPNQNTRPGNGGSSNGYNPNQNTRPGNGGSSNGYNPNQNTRPSTSNTGSNGYNPNGYNPNQNTRPSNGGSSSNGYNPGQNTRPPSSNTGSNGYNPNQGTRPGGGNSNGNNWNNGNTGGNSYRPTPSPNEEPIWGSTSRVTTSRSTAGSSNNGGWTGGSNNGGWTGTTQPQKRISELKCAEYARNVTTTISVVPLSINAQATSHQVQGDCPFQATQLIVGGSKANLGEYPHMAALGFKSGNSVVYNCGGTLISEDYVLTAAHCTHSSFGNPVHVRLGDLNLVKDDDAQPQIINVASVTVHPNYKAPQLYNDIALIRLARRVPFSKTLRPACLQVKRAINADKVVATGWGSTNYGEISSDDLLKVALDLIDNSQCNTLYGPDNKLRNGITETMLCAGELSGKKDTCQGDSGGPLQVRDINNKCIHYIVGITSFGKSCGAVNSPGIYTRVSEYVPWIESIVWKNQRI